MTTLEFSPIVAPEQGLTAPVVSLKTAALAHFSALEAPLRDLAERYRAVAWDPSTAKGLAAMKAARNDLRENGRYAVQRAEEAFKKAANEAKTAVAPKVDELIGIVRPTEDDIDKQIKAHEERVAAEKAAAERAAAEAARVEADRKQRHEDGIATLAGYISKASGKPAAQILNGITFVRGITIDPAQWQEFTDRAQAQLDATLQALAGLHAAAVKAEAEAAELEQLRAEKAAREQRERAEVAQLAAAQARAAEEARQRAAAEVVAATPMPTAPPVAAPELTVGEHVREVFGEDHPVTVALVAGAVPREQAADLGSLETSEAEAIEPRRVVLLEPEPATLNLGAINARFDGRLKVDAAGLALMGINPAATDKSAKLYRESDFDRLCVALREFIGTVQAAAAEVA